MEIRNETLNRRDIKIVQTFRLKYRRYSKI